jgi:hypothetical protein
MTNVRIAWWNLENCFDHATAQRDPDLRSVLASELVGWTAAVRDQKLDQLAQIIMMMFSGAGPDLLGVCEIENERVLEMLKDRLNIAGRDYRILSHNSPDARGIDVSFIYDHSLLLAANPGHQVVVKRTSTRDLFWCDITLRSSQNTVTVIGNHWPARSAGVYESEPFRMLTAETVSYLLSTLLASDANRPILVMGDFNDEPFNRSIKEYLLGTRDRGRVTRSRSAPRLWNPMWSLLSGDPPGTYRYGSTWHMLDQFLISKGLSRTNATVRYSVGSASILVPPIMVGPGGAPLRHGRPSRQSSYDSNGYSDHFPITLDLIM